MIDWTINVYHLGIVAVAAIGMAYAMRSEIRILKHDFGSLSRKQDDLSSSFSQLGNILTKVAVQDQRLAMIEKAVDELRHGQGFIKGV